MSGLYANDKLAWIHVYNDWQQPMAAHTDDTRHYIKPDSSTSGHSADILYTIITMIKTLAVLLVIVAVVAASTGYGYDENRDGLNDRQVIWINRKQITVDFTLHTPAL